MDKLRSPSINTDALFGILEMYRSSIYVCICIVEQVEGFYMKAIPLTTNKIQIQIVWLNGGYEGVFTAIKHIRHNF